MSLNHVRFRFVGANEPEGSSHVMDVHDLPPEDLIRVLSSVGTHYTQYVVSQYFHHFTTTNIFIVLFSREVMKIEDSKKVQ